MKKKISGILLILCIVITSVPMKAYASEEIMSVTLVADRLKMTYDVISSWENHHNVTVTLTNISKETIENWTIQYDFQGGIENIWNAQANQNDNTILTVSNLGWNQDIKVGESITYGCTVCAKEPVLPTWMLLLNSSQSSVKKDVIIEYNQYSAWEDGINAAITIKNNSGKEIKDWSLEFDYINGITDIWNAVIESKDKNHYIIKNASYNQNIAPNSMITIGFLAKANDVNAVIMNPKLTELQAVANMESETGISINTEFFLWDDTIKKYYVTEEITNLSGTILEPEKAKNAYYMIKNTKGSILLSGEIQISEVYSIDKIGFLLGENILTVGVNYKNGVTEEETVSIINFNEYNAETVPVDYADNDSDGICNYLEDFYGMNKDTNDTDKDGVSDYFELVKLETNPILNDTNGNGVLDGAEDLDGDGLSVLDEIAYGTSPILGDTDKDELMDREEIEEYDTNPLVKDTDGDGATDKWEVENGYNPLKMEEIFKVWKEAFGGPVYASVSLEVSGEQIETLQVEAEAENRYITRNVPGFMGLPYSFEIEGDLNSSAEISFYFNEKEYDNDNVLPTIYYLNEEYGVLEELPTSVDWEEGRAKATVEHFSTYVLLNKKEFDTVWNEDIRKPKDDATIEEGVSISFVLDRSLSMSWNDANRLRLTLTKQFIEKLEENKDLGSVISFIANAEVLTGLTNDVEELKDAVDNIVDDSGYNYNSGTNGSAGIYEALQQLINDESGNSRYIIFMTDGEDNVVSHSYTSLIETAQMSEVTIFTVGLGSVNAEVLQQLADETGGKYYYASAAEELTDIFKETEKETIDYHKDSNGDNISDYYTRILCESGLYLNGTRNPFAGYSYESIQAKSDYDGDGLLNGQEIKVEEYNGFVRIVMYADPTTKYSDTDMYSDYEEVKYYGSNPMAYNYVFREEDVNYLTSSSNFVASDYLRFYENESYSWTEKLSIWLGNNVFGSNNDTVYMYKCALMEVIQDAVMATNENDEMLELTETSCSILTAMADSVDLALDKARKIDEANIKDLEDLRDTIHTTMEDIYKIDISKGQISKEQIYEEWEEMYRRYNTQSLEIEQLSSKLEFYKKIDGYLEKFNMAFEATSLVGEFTSFIKTQTAFTANINEMQESVMVLNEIYNECDDEKLAKACKELIMTIESKKEADKILYFDVMRGVGNEILCSVSEDIAQELAKKLALGTVLKWVSVIIEVGDLVFNFSKVAEVSTYLYAIVKSTEIYNAEVVENLKSGTIVKGYVSFYDNVQSKEAELFYLTILRCCSERKMEQTNEAYTFLVEYFLSEHVYNHLEIRENISLLLVILLHYWNVPAETFLEKYYMI